jgi:predicted transglutaminase-like cysteine proteinase
MKRTILLALLVTILIAGEMLPASCTKGFSHQPCTINQMKMLVIPDDPVVPQALQEALGTADTTSTVAPSSIIADINKIRLWVYSNIKQTSDEALHGVNDYWQTPAETLALKAGDCEDFAILVVSMLRAYGIPKDQVYIAVGDDANKNSHAFVVERYSYGAWVEFDPQRVDDAVLLDGDMALDYDIAYCFNDQGGFDGIPVYPSGYIIPTASIVPVIPNLDAIYISDIASHNKDLDTAKQRLGELWLPTYLPQDYVFDSGMLYIYSGWWSFSLGYLAGLDRIIDISETNQIGTFDVDLFQPGTYEQTIINNQPAYFGVFTFSTGTGASKTVISGLIFGFIQGNLQVRVTVSPPDSLTHEELIKIAESFTAY